MAYCLNCYSNYLKFVQRQLRESASHMGQRCHRKQNENEVGYRNTDYIIVSGKVYRKNYCDEV